MAQMGTAVSPWPVHSAKILTLLGSCSAPCCYPGIRVCVGVDLPQRHGHTLTRIVCVAIKERLSDSKALRNAGVTTSCTRPATVDHLVNMCHRAREPSPMARE